MSFQPPSPQQPEWLSLATARVRDAFIRRPHYADGGENLVTLCRRLAQLGLTHALVRDGERLGIFTTTDLRDALLRDVPPAALAVRDVARFDLVDVDADAELFEALWLMVRHRVHRLVVRDGDAVIGLLGQLDLVSFVANHSHIVALQIDDAATVDDLRAASARIDAMVEALHANGTRIERIAQLVGELNARLIGRLWSLVAPPELVAASCLVLMGSEGRSEQILKTDQDNALLLRDGVGFDGLDAVAGRFAEALEACGWPPCPGGVMLTNPLWRQPLAAFRATLADWVHGSVADGPMNLAMFLDAVPVAGDGALLAAAREQLDRIVADSDAFAARFAAVADRFDEPAHWWSRLTSRRDEQPLDLKRLGLFPIVHGVRALALRQHVRAVGTAARLAALVERGELDEALARDLRDALHLLMRLRLAHQLAQRREGRPADNLLVPATLGTIERDALHDALAIVRRFRALLRQRLRLDAL